MIVAVSGAALALGGCRSDVETNKQTNGAAEPQGPATNLAAAVPTPETLDRAALLQAVGLAASAAATGSDDSADQRKLDGRQFEVRVRFGCSGPSESLRSAALGWSFDEAERTLRVRAAPTISGDEPKIVAVAPPDTETVEGFWIPRPWIVSAACPRAPVAPSAEEVGTEPKASEEPETGPAAVPRVGLAEFFGPSDARTGRRGQRAYESTKVLEEGRAVGSSGFNLVLSGRLRQISGGKVINCIVEHASAPPECVVAVNFDQVWIEWPEGRQILAQWSRS